ncbi:MAG: cupin domain-containing protein [Actinobacteria bacterium]|nr:cupin domain-containing protein [Actinomycetota bacterium]
MPDSPAAHGQLIRPSTAPFERYDLASRDVDVSGGLTCEVAISWAAPSGLRFGIARFTPGRMSFVSKVDEVLVARSGRIRISIDDAPAVEPEPGDAVYFAIGQHVVYEVLDDFEEWFWVIESPADE